MNKTKYVLGLDVGVGSLGWSVVDLDENNKPRRLHRAGVRIFSLPENPKSGEKLNVNRREKRSQRRVINRRQNRLKELKRLFVDAKVVQNISIFSNKEYIEIDPWKVRSDSLDRLLSGQELSKSILHIAKHRGFNSNRKKQSDKEGGLYKPYIEKNELLMSEKGYRSIGEMFYKDEAYATRKRNTNDSYVNMLSRKSLLEEMKKILEKQSELGNKLLDEKLRDKIVEVAFRQKSFSDEALIKKMVGYCTLERTEKRSAKRAFSFELFSSLSKLNNFRMYRSENRYNEIILETEQREKIANLLLSKHEIKFSEIRKTLDIDKTILFKGCDYYSARKKLYTKPEDMLKINEEEIIKKAEEQKFLSMKGFHELISSIKKYNDSYLEKYADNYEILDEIAYIITLNKDETECVEKLTNLGIEKELAEFLFQEISYEGFGHLSLKAIKKLLPHLKEGKLYSEAVAIEYPDNKQFERFRKLPPINQEEIRNHIVMRALSQTRKVINAIVDKYGSPTYINIELARDLSKDFSERRKITKLIEENRERTEKEIDEIKELFDINYPSGTDIIKYRLWKEQNEQSIYSGNHINPDILFTNATQIDHAIPYSRSMNDSYKNKVLCLVKENQEKKDLTPYEYLGEKDNSEKWNQFEARIESLKMMNPYKKKNLLRKEVPKAGDEIFKTFVERDLNDTRYISKYLKNLLEDHLEFAESEMKRKVFVYTGVFTSIIKRRLGLSDKDREINNRHHAIDATLLAVSNPGYIQQVSAYSQKIEKDGDYFKKIKQNEYKFPEPWTDFHKDIEQRIMSDEPEKILEISALKDLYSDMPNEIEPLLVSKTPNREVDGSAHDDTLVSPKLLETGTGYLLKRVSIDSLKKENIDSIYGDDLIKEVIRERMNLHDNDSKKAFIEPIYKPSKNGKPNIIRKVTLKEYTSGTVSLNNGKSAAGNGKMVRIDIFTKNDKFYIIPIYVNDTTNASLPDRAIVAKKPETEWELIDDTYNFMYSIYPNDFVRIEKNGKVIEGYYNFTDRSTGSIKVSQHDNENGKSIGLKTVDKIEKYHIDPLGNKFLIVKEKRVGFKENRNK